MFIKYYFICILATHFTYLSSIFVILSPWRLKPRLHVQTGLSNYSTFVQTNLKQWLDGQTASIALAMQRLFIYDFLSVCGLPAGSSTNSWQTVWRSRWAGPSGKNGRSMQFVEWFDKPVCPCNHGSTPQRRSKAWEKIKIL